MATPSLPPKFAELDSSRLYSLRNVLTGGEVFRFVVSLSGHRITIMKETTDIGHITGDQLEKFEDDRFEIQNIGEAPRRNSASVKTAAYREQTAYERANAFIRSQAEKAARANATNENNPYKTTYDPGKNSSKKINAESRRDLIHYFGLEKVPANKVKKVIERLSQKFYKEIYNTSTSVKINETKFKTLVQSQLIPLLKDFNIDINAQAYKNHLTYSEDIRLLNILYQMIRNEHNTARTNQRQPNNTSRNGNGNGTAIENLNMWLLENNSNPREGGGAGMGGGSRKKRHTKRRSMKRRHRTRRH